MGLFFATAIELISLNKQNVLKMIKDKKTISDLSAGVSPLLCAVLVQLRHNVFGLVNSYYKCEKPAKYKVTYRQSHNGESKTEYMCGVHLTGVKKSSERLKRRTGFDSELKVECL